LSNLIFVILRFLIIEFFRSLIIENFNNLITIDVDVQHLAQNTSFVGFLRHAQMKTMLEAFVRYLKATNSDENMK
jgi:hypothetical protein